MSPSNYILTGPPRSGTTLACFLLNKVPDTVALHEPMNLKLFPDRQSGLLAIEQFFDAMRTSLLTEGKALSKASKSMIPDNPFPQEKGKIRQSIVQKEWVTFDKKLTPGFNLILKQNAHFTFLLQDLLYKYPCAAIIRNPVSIIASWNTIQAPVAKGNLTVLKTLEPDLHSYLEAIPDILTRQIHLLDKLFTQYTHLPELTIIRYEDMITTGGRALQSWLPAASVLAEPLESRNRSALYTDANLSWIKDALKYHDGAWLSFYTKEELANV